MNVQEELHEKAMNEETHFFMAFSHFILIKEEYEDLKG